MSELQRKIARAIRQTREFQAGAAFGIPAESYGQATEGMADAVIAALGLTDAYGRATDGMVNQLETMQKEENDVTRDSDRD